MLLDLQGRVDTEETHHKVESRLVFLGLLPALVAMCSLKSLKKLTPLAVLGTALVGAAVVAVVVNAAPAFRQPAATRAAGPLADLPIFFSMAVYCFEGIGLALPIENAMQSKAQFRAVWLGAMAGVTSLYVAFGLFSYLAYGDATPSSITNRLPRESAVSSLVKLGVCGCLFLTFPMMMFPVFEIFEHKWPLRQLLRVRALEVPARILGRGLLVVLVTVFATLIPDFGLVISLVGALGCNAVAFILPTLFHLKVCYHKLGLVGKVRNVAIAAFGTLAMVVCTYTTVLKIERGESTH